jgi:chromate transporter
MAIVIALGALYARFGDIEALQRILGGVAAAAVGMIAGAVIKMTQPMLREGIGAIAIAIVAFLAVGLMRYPLPLVLLAMAPVSIGYAWWVRR